MGPAHQRLPRRLGGGAARRPSRGRPGARHLPHPGARHRSFRHPRHPARPHLPGPGRRRAQARHGLSVVEPALPQFPGPGRLSARRLHGCARRHRLRWAVLAGDLQRPVPQRVDASGCDRRSSLAHQSARPAARALRPGRCRPDPDAGAGEVPGRRVHRVRHGRPGGRSLRTHVAGVGFSPCRPAHLQAGHAMVSGRHQHRGQHREGGLRPLLQHHPRHGGLCAGPARRRCRCRARPRPAPARHAVPPGRRAGRAGDSRGARPGWQPDLFHRSQDRSGPRVGHRIPPPCHVKRGGRLFQGRRRLAAGRSSLNR